MFPPPLKKSQENSCKSQEIVRKKSGNLTWNFCGNPDLPISHLLSTAYKAYPTINHCFYCNRWNVLFSISYFICYVLMILQLDNNSFKMQCVDDSRKLYFQIVWLFALFVYIYFLYTSKLHFTFTFLSAYMCAS